MRFRVLSSAILALLGLPLTANAESPVERRVPWTTSHLHGSPEPPKPFIAERAFPKLEFNEGLEIVYEPVAHRWFVLEQHGKVFSFPRTGDTTTADLAGDIVALHSDVDNLYSIIFHPKYRENHFVYLTYTRGSGIADGTKLSRFIMKDVEGAPKLDLASEKVILTWRSGGHNGANLQFGPEGFLYVSTGDSEVPSPPDPLNTGQDITDLLSSILRIDVDHQDAPLAYRIPADNPFLNIPKARHEVWAYGVRNPWKMSFDRATGRLWCGDVGWELWESIHLIERGGNYGWSAMEASQPVRADTPKAPTPIRPPVVAHSHDEAASITGGCAYHGHKFPELEGAYIYGDWVTGKMWALWYDGKQVTRHDEIADTHHKIVAFGQDEDGEIAYIHYDTHGTIHQLERNPQRRSDAFPTKLSATGLYKDLAKRELADGIYPYHTISKQWLDGAETSNLIALPAQSKVISKVETRTDKDGNVKAEYTTQWPKDAVLVRTISFDLGRDQAMPAVERPSVLSHPWPAEQEIKTIETQVLHYDGADWNGYSYRWNDAGTDAELVPAGGAEQTLTLKDHREPSGQKKYSWRFASRAECLRCHNPWCGGALGFQPVQLDHQVFRDKQAMELNPKRKRSLTDQLLALQLFNSTFVEQSTIQLVPCYNEGFSVNDRARSYLHANCSHCHRQNAGGAVNMWLNAELTLGQTRTAGFTPQQGGLGLPNPKLIAPGNPWNSAICVRLAKMGTGHMPLIGSHEIDVAGLNLIEDWIASMGSAGSSATALLPEHWLEAEVNSRLKNVEGAMQVLRAIDEQAISGELRQFTLQAAWKSTDGTIRDLFERFKPADQRVETLGLNPSAAKILALQGDAKRGAELLSVQGKLNTCFGCHIVAGTGRDFGPELSHIASRLKREQILESILQPSKVIAPGYAAYAVTPKSGAPQIGFIVKDEASAITLKIATGQSLVFQKADIASQIPLPASLMPEGLVQALTAQEAADAVSFLESMK